MGSGASDMACDMRVAKLKGQQRGWVPGYGPTGGGRTSGRFTPAASGIPLRQERQIVRSARD